MVFSSSGWRSFGTLGWHHDSLKTEEESAHARCSLMDEMMSTSSGLPYHNVGDFYPRKLGPKPDVVPSGVTERKVVPLDKPDMVSVDVINVGDSGLLC